MRNVRLVLDDTENAGMVQVSCLRVHDHPLRIDDGRLENVGLGDGRQEAAERRRQFASLEMKSSRVQIPRCGVNMS